MAAIDVRILGDLEMWRAGRKVALPASKKTRALLGYLVVTASPHLRERLCDLLWQGPDDPRGALRWSLTKLRALLDEGRIRAEHDRVAFEPDGAECDLWCVRAALAKGVASASTEGLREAAARFRGELLDGLDLPDAYRYHEWCVGEREAARAMRVEILSALVERCASEPEAALVFARQRLAVDPLVETAHVVVVKLLVKLGRKREAGEQVDACKRILERELGTKPSAALLSARVASAFAGRDAATELAPNDLPDAPEVRGVLRAEHSAQATGYDVLSFKQDIRFTRSADGTRLAYAVHGEGYPLVRAAHWLTNIEVDWQTPVWRPWFDALGARFRFHRYDSRGCGLSDRDATEVSLDLLVSDLEAVVDAAGLERFALLGSSQGGAISIVYAARHPERVSHLVLMGAFARGPLRRAPSVEQLESIRAQIKLIEVGWGQNHPAFLQLFTSQIFPGATPAQAHSFNDLQRMCCSPEHAARLVSAYYDLDASPYLARIACPTLVLHGRGDVRVPFDTEGLFVASSIPGARLVPLETNSHTPLAGEPSFDRVIKEIGAFVPR